MRDLPKLIVLAMLLPLVAGCARNLTPSTGITASARPPVCTQWKGISYSQKNDTAQTVSEIRVNNASRQAYCEGSDAQ